MRTEKFGVHILHQNTYTVGKYEPASCTLLWNMIVTERHVTFIKILLNLWLCVVCRIEKLSLKSMCACLQPNKTPFKSDQACKENLAVKSFGMGVDQTTIFDVLFKLSASRNDP